MFTSFFYTMKSNGLDISTTEWLTLMEEKDVFDRIMELPVLRIFIIFVELFLLKTKGIMIS